MSSTRGPRHNMNAKTAWTVMKGGLLWFAFAAFLLIILLLQVLRFGRVSGEEVGVLLNKLNGNMKVVTSSGVTPYNGITNRFYTLDKTVQTMDMSERNRPPDALKIKTVDGSDVYLDLKVQYRIVPEAADTVLKTSGPGDEYKHKWARDYVRSVCRNTLGELTTEEFYDSSKRRLKIQDARNNINKLFKEFGLQVDDIVPPQKPRFYAEYEEMIKKKKLADQAVLEEKSKALAAKQRQQTQIVQETNIKNVAVEQFEGQMEQLIIQAEAEGERVRKESDAYFDRVTIGAEANLYQKKKTADGIMARKLAEAQGIEAMKKALEGEGGRNMVKMEYAKKLRNVKIKGQPFVVEGRVDKFQHSYDPEFSAPAAARPNPKSK